MAKTNIKVHGSTEKQSITTTSDLIHAFGENGVAEISVTISLPSATVSSGELAKFLGSEDRFRTGVVYARAQLTPTNTAASALRREMKELSFDGNGTVTLTQLEDAKKIIDKGEVTIKKCLMTIQKDYLDLVSSATSEVRNEILNKGASETEIQKILDDLNFPSWDKFIEKFSVSLNVKMLATGISSDLPESLRKDAHEGIVSTVTKLYEDNLKFLTGKAIALHSSLHKQLSLSTEEFKGVSHRTLGSMEKTAKKIEEANIVGHSVLTTATSLILEAHKELKAENWIDSSMILDELYDEISTLAIKLGVMDEDGRLDPLYIPDNNKGGDSVTA